MHDKKGGYTFSTLPALGFLHRADRVMYRSSDRHNIEVLEASLHGGDPTVNNTYPSDHLGLYVKFRVVGTCTQ